MGPQLKQKIYNTLSNLNREQILQLKLIPLKDDQNNLALGKTVSEFLQKGRAQLCAYANLLNIEDKNHTELFFVWSVAGVHFFVEKLAMPKENPPTPMSNKS